MLLLIVLLYDSKTNIKKMASACKKRRRKIKSDIKAHTKVFLMAKTYLNTLTLLTELNFIEYCRNTVIIRGK